MTWLVGIGLTIFLFFTFPRQMAALAGILILAAVLIVGWFNYQDAARRAEISKISATAGANVGACRNVAYPIQVWFHNGTGRTINSMSFELVGKRPGHSSNVISMYENTDQIMKPGSSWYFCYPDHEFDYEANRTAGLQWSIESIYPTFAH